LKKFCFPQYNKRIIVLSAIFFNGFVPEEDCGINTTKHIIRKLTQKIEQNREDFSHFNIVRMREAIRYLSPEKLEIFVKIPFLLHINDPRFPGFSDTKAAAHGIWNFEESGFFKEVVKTRLFPKSITETCQVENSCILGLYHIGSLGTFTQSSGSDFDYWVIIDKKNFSKERYDHLEKKLDDILKYCRETYHQEVSFFIMDQKEICRNHYAPFDGKESLSAPKIFLKEEFYRTFLMIAGKIPLWSVLPDIETDAAMNMDAMTAQILSMYEDLMDLGTISALPEEDILKGLLWHVCKSKEDPVKALIKATMIFSYGYGQTVSKTLLCEKIKHTYAKAGIDDYAADPYKMLFDRILEFHEKDEPAALNLIKNAIFFRLTEYPNVKMPENDTPKRALLNKYIRDWKLNKNQVGKLLSYTEWSESEKLLLEQTIVNRLAQMYNRALKSIHDSQKVFENPAEKRNWTILKNKIKHRLKKAPEKIPECSTYLHRQKMIDLDIVQGSDLWVLNAKNTSGRRLDSVYKHSSFLGVLGWIFENELYRRHTSSINIHMAPWLFESTDQPIETDKIYMSFAPFKPLSDDIFLNDAVWSKMIVAVFFDITVKKGDLIKTELLVSNTWGELFLDVLEFGSGEDRTLRTRKIAKKMSKYQADELKIAVFQISETHDPDIVYQIKKEYNNLTNSVNIQMLKRKKLYLDKL